LFTIQEAGGGGFGDAARRDPEKIREDYRLGFISLQGANLDYGLELEPEDE